MLYILQRIMKVIVLCEPQGAIQMKGAIAVTSALAGSSCFGPSSD